MSIEQIRTLSIFDEVTAQEFEEITNALEAKEYQINDMIAVEEEDNNEPLVLAWAGSVNVLKNAGQSNEKSITILNAPTILGELELITDIPYSAGLKCESAVKAFIFPRAKFHEMRQAGHTGVMKMIFNMSKILAMRLYHTNKALSESGETADIDKLRKTTLTWVL